MTTAQGQQSRAEFLQYALTTDRLNCCNPAVDPDDGKFYNDELQYAFELWQAARAQNDSQERKPLTHELIVEIDEQALRDVRKRPRRGYCELLARGVEAAHGIKQGNA